MSLHMYEKKKKKKKKKKKLFRSLLVYLPVMLKKEIYHKMSVRQIAASTAEQIV